MGYAGLQPEDPREIGPYRLLGQLGSGGMGQVFLAMSAGGRPIAVKVIRTELANDPDFRGRFRRDRDRAADWAERMVLVVEQNPTDLILVMADMARANPPLSGAFLAEMTRHPDVSDLARKIMWCTVT